MRDLRRALASIVLAAPLAGCFTTGTCPVASHDDTFTIDDNDPDPNVQPLIAQCEQQGDCDALCDALFTRKYQAGALLTTCDLLDTTTPPSQLHVAGKEECIGGRRPGNYRAGVADDTCNAVARYLVRQAELEAASVRAFGDLYADLVELNAPAALCRAAIKAAADEVRHAEACARLARRFGASPAFHRIAPAARRDLRALALDNAAEGCVRETYGAAVAGYQARTAQDRVVARAMYRIARDEAKHAALSWRIQRWVMPRLALADRPAVLATAARARAELAISTTEPALQSTLGLPAPAAATAMLGELDARVWSPLGWRS
ncbi:MAG: ferritin-like domain-containing protein [Kofleriaceae bacterium]